MLETGLRLSLQSNPPLARPMGSVELGLILPYLAARDAEERPQEWLTKFLSFLPERFRAAVKAGLPSLDSQHLRLKL